MQDSIDSKLVSTPTAQPALPEHCTVFLADVSQSVIEARTVRSLLSKTEVYRAERFRSAERRQQFMQCRALLRVLLAERANQRADEITIDEEPFGKPVLSGKAAGSGIHFNLSHSGLWALIAISTSGEVGVDIEQCRPRRDISGIADNFYAACEQQAIQAMATTDREAAFYRCWCRKEAFAKATGLGLRLPFNRFTVNVEAGASAELLSVDYESLLVSQWQMHTLQVPEGYFAALTVKRAGE